MSELPQPGPVPTDEDTNSRWSISIVWVLTSILVIIVSAFLTGIAFDVAKYLDAKLMTFSILFSIPLSIFHPGGWLSIIGLVLALKHRSYRWLYLSLGGAVLTGIASTMLILVGLGTVAV